MEGLIARCAFLGVPPSRLLILDPTDPAWIIPFNPFLAPGEPHAIADGFANAIHRRHPDSWGVEIDLNLRHICYALVVARQSPLEIDRVFTCRHFRKTIVDKVTDPYVRSYFDRFETASSERRAQWHLAVTNKLSPFLFNPHIRRVLCGDSRLDLQSALCSPSAIILTALRRPRLHDAGNLIGDLLLSSVWNGVLNRDPEQRRIRNTLILDEFQHYAHGCAGEMIAEGRNYGLRIIAAHQMQAQIDPDLRAALRNSAATRVMFNVGPVDAPEMAREFFCYSGPEARGNLLTLQTGEAYVAQRGSHPIKVVTPDIDRAGIEVGFRTAQDVIRIAEYREAAMRCNASRLIDVDREIAERSQNVIEAASFGSLREEVRHVRMPRRS